MNFDLSKSEGTNIDDWSDSESESEQEDWVKANLRDLVRRSHLSTADTSQIDRFVPHLLL